MEDVKNIGIHPHDKLILGIKDNILTLTKHEGSVFDLQKKKVAAGTLKKSLVFERKLDRAGKKDSRCRNIQIIKN